MSAQGSFEKGLRDGKWSYYHENGEISSEGAISGGQKDGYWKLYHEDGTFKGESILKDGDGPYKEYYDNGNIKIRGQLRDGKNEGKWLYYKPDGTLEGEADFVDGNGTYTGYYEDGNVKMTGQMENGKNIGIWKLFEKDGSLAGYYRPYYEANKPIFKIIEKNEVQSEEQLDNMKPEYKYKNRKIKYFTQRVNEFKGIIIGTNPVTTTLGQLPVSLEYYLQERLGHEIQYTLIRDPFFTKNARITNTENYKRGFSVALRQKFYHPDQNLGMFYFGHEIRFSAINHMANITNNGSGIYYNTIDASENTFEYSIIVGDRIIKFFGEKWVNEADKSGITVDIYGGLGVGYRNYKKNYPDKYDYDHIFKDIDKSKLTVPVRFGINIGYVF